MDTVPPIFSALLRRLHNLGLLDYRILLLHCGLVGLHGREFWCILLLHCVIVLPARTIAFRVIDKSLSPVVSTLVRKGFSRDLKTYRQLSEPCCVHPGPGKHS